VFNATDINGVAGQTCNGFANSGPCVYWSRSGSWQGHNIPYTTAGTWIDLPATNKYWALGGRCAR
jgi:hypothetical protein